MQSSLTGAAGSWAAIGREDVVFVVLGNCLRNRALGQNIVLFPQLSDQRKHCSVPRASFCITRTVLFHTHRPVP